MLRVPRHFLGENRFAIHHGGDFVIARAQIKADAAAFQMAARRRLHFLVRGNFSGRGKDDLKFFAVGTRHHFAIKFPRAARGIGFADEFADRFRPAKVQFPAAARPEQKFHNALHIAQRVGVRLGRTTVS